MLGFEVGIHVADAMGSLKTPASSNTVLNLSTLKHSTSLSYSVFILKQETKPYPNKEYFAFKMSFSIRQTFYDWNIDRQMFAQGYLTLAHTHYLTSTTYLFRPLLAAEATSRKTAKEKLYILYTPCKDEYDCKNRTNAKD